MMRDKDFYLTAEDCQKPLNFSDDNTRFLLHHPTGNKIITHDELEWFCQKCFGEVALFAEDALLHGQSLNIGSGLLSIEVLH
ncbi:hypothetical protein [Fangia hongkongensis]|uniref:hypothetical protein n=2 Tax=Fangia hongkongensis TaxID=270495 RepID=UPI0003A4393E|nr:hypothetical protein [Fangia hongkongensis]MBK2123754.1 hypothetical protein [Fangia hongkongensis]